MRVLCIYYSVFQRFQAWIQSPIPIFWAHHLLLLWLHYWFVILFLSKRRIVGEWTKFWIGTEIRIRTPSHSYLCKQEVILKPEGTPHSVSAVPLTQLPCRTAGSMWGIFPWMSRRETLKISSTNMEKSVILNWRTIEALSLLPSSDLKTHGEFYGCSLASRFTFALMDTLTFMVPYHLQWLTAGTGWSRHFQVYDH